MELWRRIFTKPGWQIWFTKHTKSVDSKSYNFGFPFEIENPIDDFLSFMICFSSISVFRRCLDKVIYSIPVRDTTAKAWTVRRTRSKVPGIQRPSAIKAL
jgi:hypothetical protein